MLDNIIEFLNDYRWVFDFKWTEISLLKQWHKLPPLWVKFFEDIKFDEIKKLILCDFSFKHVPQDIQNFFLFSNNISKFFSENSNKNYPVNNFKNINPKKSHEIIQITKFFKTNIIDNYETGSITILDVGSGLGNLSRILQKDLGNSYNMSIIVVEGDSDLHNRNMCVKGMEKLHFFITDTNLEEFNSKIESISSKVNIITGLHCCGLLSCNILKYYANFSSADDLLLFSCCYHRMFNGDLTGFPMSEIYQQKQINFVSAAFLRLGCQENKQTWLKWSEEEYFRHQYTVAFRCAIEAIDSNFPNDNLKKLKRVKLFNHTKFEGLSFKQFVESKISELNLENKMNFLKEISKQNDICHWYSVFFALQVSIQEVIEYFILLDRLLYLKEFPSIKVVELIKIFEPSISPRHIAIFARK